MKAFLAVRTGRQEAGVVLGAQRALKREELVGCCPCWCCYTTTQLCSLSVAAQHFRISFFRCCECGRDRSPVLDPVGRRSAPWGWGSQWTRKAFSTTLIIAEVNDGALFLSPSGWKRLLVFMSQSKPSTPRTSSRAHFQTPLGLRPEQKLPMTPQARFLLPVEGPLYHLAMFLHPSWDRGLATKISAQGFGRISMFTFFCLPLNATNACS